MELRPLLFLAVTTFMTNAYAGGVDGGGGKSVVCRDEKQNITSAELLDIWEGKNIFDLTIEHDGDVNTILNEAKAKLKNSLDNPEVNLFPLIDRVKSIMKIAKPGVILKDVDDTAEIALPQNCKLEQLANYQDDSFLLVSGEIWNRLDNVNKAGLILHEAIYRSERYGDAKNSRRARKIVAHILSDFTFEFVQSGLPENAIECMAFDKGRVMKYKYYIYPKTSNPNMSQLQFVMMDGKWVYSKKTLVLPISFPWKKPDHPGIFSNGDTLSNFEGNEFIGLGLFQEITDDGNTINQYYYLSQNDKDFITYCNR